MAEYQWKYEGDKPITIKKFMSQVGLGHRLLADIKYGDGVFRMNAKVESITTIIEPGEVVTLVTNPIPEDPEVKVSDEPIEIVYEDQNWLVVNKPAGLSSIPGPTNSTDTLLNRVKGYLIQSGATDLRPSLIIRLDRFTSGIVLVAKNRVSQSMISHQVENHELDKRYTAIVSDHLELDHDVIDHPIGKVEDSPRRVVRPDGKTAQTEYWVKSTGEDWTEVEVQLHTGRTHQIRVHFTHLGHPLLGDELYGGPQTLIQRQALHAQSLSFTDPFTHEQKVFKVALPTDMSDIIHD
jgi:23S rRNA pseudouridine1911/1915/1917 synthase